MGSRKKLLLEGPKCTGGDGENKTEGVGEGKLSVKKRGGGNQTWIRGSASTKKRDCFFKGVTTGKNQEKLEVENWQGMRGSRVKPAVGGVRPSGRCLKKDLSLTARK